MSKKWGRRRVDKRRARKVRPGVGSTDASKRKSDPHILGEMPHQFKTKRSNATLRNREHTKARQELGKRAWARNGRGRKTTRGKGGRGTVTGFV